MGSSPTRGRATTTKSKFFQELLFLYSSASNNYLRLKKFNQFFVKIVKVCYLKELCVEKILDADRFRLTGGITFKSSDLLSDLNCQFQVAFSINLGDFSMSVSQADSGRLNAKHFI